MPYPAFQAFDLGNYSSWWRDGQTERERALWPPSCDPPTDFSEATVLVCRFCFFWSAAQPESQGPEAVSGGKGSWFEGGKIRISFSRFLPFDYSSVGVGRGGRMGFSSDNLKGFVLALSSSAFIGASFIIKKKGLRRAADASGVRAGGGGHTYLLEPLWWVGMITMIVGEVANFVAYAFAPAVLITPLGALSIIVSAVLAHFILKEKLHDLGILGCIMCITGSIVIVIHAPEERPITSVMEIWNMATQTAFLLYVASVIALVFVLVFHFAPLYGQSNVLVYTGICSLMGSLSVMSVKALGTSLKLTFEGSNQFVYPQTWFFTLVVLTCVITQMDYLNRALDTFNTAVVSPIYYVMFTTLTIVASVIMFKDWDGQSGESIISEICGFIIVLSGTILLHVTKDLDRNPSRSVYARLSPSLSAHLCDENGESLKHVAGDGTSSEGIFRRQELY